MNKKIGINWVFKSARFPAFTVVEIMIVMLIVAVVGGVAVSAFFITFKSFRQTEDHVTAAREVEYAMNTLRLQFTNIGLGMPNNAQKTGSFNLSFTGPTGSHPIMAYMGDINGHNKDWGGPVTIGSGNARNSVSDPNSFAYDHNDDGVFAGEELFYAWAVPTGVRLQRGFDANERFINDNSIISLRFLDNGDVKKLKEFTYDYGREIGVSNVNRGANVRSWIVFPSFRVPLLIEEGSSAIDETGNVINVKVSPYYSDPDNPDNYFEGFLHGYEEVHLVQAACIFAERGNLIQRIYGERANNNLGYKDNVLASNVLGVYFVFDDTLRILTMYTVTRGNSSGEAKPADNRDYLRSKLPRSVPANFIRDEFLNYRIIVESMTWRIRN